MHQALYDMFVVDSDVVSISGGSGKGWGDVIRGAYTVKTTEGTSPRRKYVEVKYKLMSICVIGFGCEMIIEEDDAKVKQWVRNHVLKRLGDTWKIMQAIAEKNYQEGHYAGRKQVQDAFQHALNM